MGAPGSSGAIGQCTGAAGATSSGTFTTSVSGTSTLPSFFLPIAGATPTRSRIGWTKVAVGAGGRRAINKAPPFGATHFLTAFGGLLLVVFVAVGVVAVGVVLAGTTAAADAAASAATAAWNVSRSLPTGGGGGGAAVKLASKSSWPSAPISSTMRSARRAARLR